MPREHTQQGDLIRLLLFIFFFQIKNVDRPYSVLLLTAGTWKPAEESVALQKADFEEVGHLMALSEAVDARIVVRDGV
jgi:hypothetical protein